MSEYEVAKEGNTEVPGRDELMIELSILMGQLDEGASWFKNAVGEIDKSRIVMTTNLYQRQINILRRALAYVRASS